MNLRSGSSSRGLHRPEDRLRLHHHPFASAIGPIIDRPVSIGREFSQVSDLDLDKSLLCCLPDHAPPEGRLEQVGEDGQDFDEHELHYRRLLFRGGWRVSSRSPSGNSTWMQEPVKSTRRTNW